MSEIPAFGWFVVNHTGQTVRTFNGRCVDTRPPRDELPPSYQLQLVNVKDTLLSMYGTTDLEFQLLPTFRHAKVLEVCDAFKEQPYQVPAATTVAQAYVRGFRVTSRAKGITAALEAGWSEPVLGHGGAMFPDWYRRCMSKTKSGVNPDWTERLPSSSDCRSACSFDPPGTVDAAVSEGYMLLPDGPPRAARLHDGWRRWAEAAGETEYQYLLRSPDTIAVPERWLRKLPKAHA